MKQSVARSPYVWTLVAIATVVIVAWVGRESYRPVITGSVAPEFSMTVLGAGEANLTDFRGKVVLVNVWATWCGPCLQEMPSMQRLYEAFGDEDFEILAVSVDAPFGEADAFGRPGGDLEGFATQLGLTFPILQNPTGDIQRQYQTTGVPESFLLDKNGVIVKKVAGPTEWDSKENQELIRRLLAA
jgi:thiol-disulfide isomerase/thioredoxin